MSANLSNLTPMTHDESINDDYYVYSQFEPRKSKFSNYDKCRRQNLQHHEGIQNPKIEIVFEPWNNARA